MQIINNLILVKINKNTIEYLIHCELQKVDY